MKVITTYSNLVEKAKTYTFTLRATNAVGYDEKTYTITVLPAEEE